MAEFATGASALVPLAGAGGLGLVVVAGIRAYRDIRIAKPNQAVEMRRIEVSAVQPTGE